MDLYDLYDLEIFPFIVLAVGDSSLQHGVDFFQRIMVNLFFRLIFVAFSQDSGDLDLIP